MKTMKTLLKQAAAVAQKLYHKAIARFKRLATVITAKATAAVQWTAAHRTAIFRTLALGLLLAAGLLVWGRSPTMQAVVKSAISHLRHNALPTARQVGRELRPVRLTRPAVVAPRLGGVTEAVAEEIPAAPAVNGR